MSEASNKPKTASNRTLGQPRSPQNAPTGAPSRTPQGPGARQGRGGPRPQGEARQGGQPGQGARPQQARAPRPDGEGGSRAQPRREPKPRLTPEEQAARAAERAFRNPLPPITFPEDLPVSGRRHEIAEALQKHQVIIVSGETGSGKTTQLPKICLELGRGQKALIGHTQPRRIAASSTAKRIAQELGTPLGETVGFKVRFADTLMKGASVKLMTDGILLAETQTDPLLKNYDTIIIDEAHERSLNIDFLLGYLKQLLPRRPDLKVIITSATIDAERFSRHFGTPDMPAPVIEVSGRLYKVEVRYRPIESDVQNPAVANAEGKGQRLSLIHI